MKRSSELKRTAQMKRGDYKQKNRRKKFTPEEEAQRALTSKRSGDWCEVRIPGECLGAATNKQHRLPTGRGGPTVVSNLLDVCGMGNTSGCHGYIHNHPTLSVDNGWTVESGQSWRDKPVMLFDGFYILGDDGRLYDPPHKRRCAVWTSIDPCDCEDTV